MNSKILNILTEDEIDLINHLNKHIHVNTSFGRTNTLINIINKLITEIKNSQ
jgi:hypothetical protein